MYESDQHASEALQSWVNKHKFSLIIGISTLIISILATQAWLDHKKQLYLQASTAFNTATKNNNNQQFENVIAQYPNTNYAALSAIVLSKKSIETNQLNQAIDLLQTAIKYSSQPELSDIASFRLARIYLKTNQIELAKNTLDKISTLGKKYYTYNLIAGDLASKQASYTEAIMYYKKAKQSLPKNSDKWQALYNYINAKINQANNKLA